MQSRVYKGRCLFRSSQSRCHSISPSARTVSVLANASMQAQLGAIDECKHKSAVPFQRLPQMLLAGFALSKLLVHASGIQVGHRVAPDDIT